LCSDSSTSCEYPFCATGIASDYVCEVSQINSRGNFSFSVHASNASCARTQTDDAATCKLLCHLSFGFGILQAGVLRIAVRKHIQYVLGPHPSDTSVVISEIITGISPSLGSAYGGTLVSVFGHGFVMPKFIRETDFSIGNVSRSLPNSTGMTCSQACNETCTHVCISDSEISMTDSFCIRECTGRCIHNCTINQDDYSLSFGGVFSPACDVKNETMIVCVSPEWLFPVRDEPVEILLWFRMTIPPVALIPGFQYGAVSPVFKYGETPPVGAKCTIPPIISPLDTCASPPLSRCNSPGQCSNSKYRGATCRTSIAGDPDSGVCTAQGSCFQHHHCPHGMLCSGSGVCVWPKVCVRVRGVIENVFLLCLRTIL
jgi:hypothetical protein